MPPAPHHRPISHVTIGRRRVGPGHPAYVIAEIGSNHNGDLDRARQMIDEAAEAGVDAAKFQTFKAERLYSRRTPGFTYLKNVDTFSLIQSLEMDRRWHKPLQEHCVKRGIEFLSSPCDAAAVAELSKLGMAAFKVPSYELTDPELVGLVARTGKPVILSTGMATIGEVQDAVEICREANNRSVVVLQCTSLYPAPMKLANLRAMDTMRRALGTVVGYSDHTLGDQAALAAVALGASAIEKHFTLDRGLPGPDHSFAIEPKELGLMVQRIRDVEAALGDGEKAGPRPQEREMFEKARRSLHARRTIRRGEIIRSNMIVTKRPGLGIPPGQRPLLVGRKARSRIEADQWITWDMV